MLQSGAIQLLKDHSDALNLRRPNEDMMKPLGYARWENFQTAINRAVESCKTTGCAAEDHFRGVTKMIEIGKGGNDPSMTSCSPAYYAVSTTWNWPLRGRIYG